MNTNAAATNIIAELTRVHKRFFNKFSKLPAEVSFTRSKICSNGSMLQNTANPPFIVFIGIHVPLKSANALITIELIPPTWVGEKIEPNKSPMLIKNSDAAMRASRVGKV